MFKERNGLLTPETSLLKMQAVGQSDQFLDLWYRQSRGENLPGRKLVLVLTAGMRRGGITTGVLSGLRDHGFTPNGLQAIVGSSVGGTVAREYAGNNLDALKGLFADDRRQTPQGFRRVIFLDNKSFPLVNFVATEDLFRQEGACEEVVKAASPEIYVGLRDMATGLSEFVDLKKVEDSVDLVISTMTVDKITRRRKRPVVKRNGERVMGADPLHKDSELIKFAVKELGATDVGVLFTSNPLENSRINTAFDYAVTILEHMGNGKHLPNALYELRYADKSPEYFKELFLNTKDVNISGFYPSKMPIAPNELNLNLMAGVINEAEVFGSGLGAAARARILAA